MVSGPYRPEKPKPPNRVAPTYNTVLHHEAPRAEHEVARHQFEKAIRHAGSQHESAKPRNDTSVSSTGRSTGSWLDSVALSHGNASFADTRVAIPGSVAAKANPAHDAKLTSSSDPTLTCATQADESRSPLRRLTASDASGNTNHDARKESTAETLREQHTVSVAVEKTANRTATIKQMDAQASQTAQFGGAADQLAGVDSSAALDVVATTDAPRVRAAEVTHGLKKSASDEDIDASMILESSGFPVLAVACEPIAEIAVAAPRTSVNNATSFETIDRMLSHLSAMAARDAPTEWDFEIQNQGSAVVSVKIKPGCAEQGEGWVVTLSSQADGHGAAQACLQQLHTKLIATGQSIQSLELVQERRA